MSLAHKSCQAQCGGQDPTQILRCEMQACGVMMAQSGGLPAGVEWAWVILETPIQLNTTYLMTSETLVFTGHYPEDLC